MSTVYLLKNQHDQYLSKSGEWVEGDNNKSLYRTAYKDEALNQKVEISVKNVEVRVSLCEAKLGDKGAVLLDTPPQAKADLPSENEQDTADSSDLLAETNLEENDDSDNATEDAEDLLDEASDIEPITAEAPTLNATSQVDEHTDTIAAENDGSEELGSEHNILPNEQAQNEQESSNNTVIDTSIVADTNIDASTDLNAHLHEDSGTSEIKTSLENAEEAKLNQEESIEQAENISQEPLAMDGEDQSTQVDTQSNDDLETSDLEAGNLETSDLETSDLDTSKLEVKTSSIPSTQETQNEYDTSTQAIS